VDERLRRLAVFGADDHDAGRTALLVTGGSDPVELEDRLEHLTVFLARYMRVDPDRIDGEPLARLRHWEQILVGFLKAEAGVDDKA
jgi:hypothetical protein